jgi:hypothetical protein
MYPAEVDRGLLAGEASWSQVAAAGQAHVCLQVPNPEVEPRGASGCTPAFSPRGKRDHENNYSAAKRRFNRVQRYIP